MTAAEPPPPAPAAVPGRAAITDGRWDPATPPVEVDLMVLYTPQALAGEGSAAALHERVRGWVDLANRVFTSSLAGVRLNPVHVGLLDYAESGEWVTDVLALANRGTAEALRSQYQADLVCLLLETDVLGDPEPVGGIPAGGIPAGGTPSAGYLLVRRQDAVLDPAERFVHAVGKRFGADYDREHALNIRGEPAGGTFAYSRAHRFVAGGVAHRTAMGYGPGVFVPFFSNPELALDGIALGVPSDLPGRADNAQTINRLAAVVAQYRTARSRIAFVETALTVAEGAGAVTVQLQRVGDLDNTARVDVAFEPAGSATAGLDYTVPEVRRVTFGTNQASAEFTLPILQDELAEGDETLRLRLTGTAPVLGVHGLGTNSVLELTILDDDDALVIAPPVADLPEAGGEVEFSVEYRGPLAEGGIRPVTVMTGGAGDTATVGVDYEVLTPQLEFTAANRRQTVRVRALADDAAEPDETLTLQVGNAAATRLILDDDRAGALLPWAAGSPVPAGGGVKALQARSDGELLLAGNFTAVNEVSRTALASLRPGGEVSDSFTPPELRASPLALAGVPNGTVFALQRDAQGRWLAGGLIGHAAGQARGHLVRLKPDGSLDAAFAATGGLDGAVYAVLEQPDGRLLVAGAFHRVDGQLRRGLARLTADGELDATFAPQGGFEDAFAEGRALARLPDGRILFGGLTFYSSASGVWRTKYQGREVHNLMRLNPDGSLDTTFPLLNSGTSGLVGELAVLPDGRAYVAGYFETIGNRNYKRLARLRADGAMDLTFQAPQPDGNVNCLLPLPNGQLLVGGAFQVIAGQSRRGVALLNADGTLDEAFDPGAGAGDHVWALAAGGDGSLAVAGAFQSFNGQPAPGLVRLRLPAIAGGLTSLAAQPDGAFKARILGLPGARYQLETSADLQAWEPAGEVRIESLDHTAEAMLPASGDRRFLRLVNGQP